MKKVECVSKCPERADENLVMFSGIMDEDVNMMRINLYSILPDGTTDSTRGRSATVVVGVGSGQEEIGGGGDDSTTKFSQFVDSDDGAGSST